MESTQTNIFDLNDYCLGQVVKYLKLEDQVRFAETCTHFREVLREWFHVLYSEFEIERCNDSDNDFVEWQLKLLDIVGDIVKRLYVNGCDGAKPVRQHEFITKLCKQIERMDNLEYIAVNEGGVRLVIPTNPVRYQSIECVLAVLERLPKLKSISLNCRTNKYRAASLIKLKCLERISTDSEISSQDLVEICKSNQKLCVLWLREVLGELEDIVPHCGNLEEIAFPMFASHKSYAALAELPQIRKVIIKGTNSTSPCGKLIELLDAFAEKGKETKLESLILFSNLNFEETSKMIQLKQLKELRCSFEDARCIDLLTDLTELEGLYIMLGRSGAGTNECLNVLRSCPNLKRLHINSNLQIDFVNKVLAVLKTVRNPEKQKPLQLYSTGLMHLCNDGEEKLVDNAYCTLVNSSEYLRPLPWKFPN